MLYLLKKDFKIIVNIKKLCFTLFAFIIILGIFSAMFTNYMQEKRLIDKMHVGVIDNEKSMLSGMLIENFKTNEEFSSLFTIVVDSEANLIKQFNNNDLSAILHIPSGFTASLLRFENTPLQMTLNSNYPLQNTVLENIMTSYSTYIKAADVAIYSLYKSLKSEDLDREILNDINDKFSVNMVVTTLNRNKLFEHNVITTFPSATSSQYFIFAIVLLIIIFTATSGSSLLSNELKTNCLQRFKTSGHNFILFSLSKSLVMYINMVLILAPLMLFVKFSNPDIELVSLIVLFLFLSLVILFFTVFSLTIGLVFHKKDMNLLFSTLITLVLGIIGGNFIPIQLMPKAIQDISSFTPNYWMLRSCLFINNNLFSKEVFMTTFILLLSSVLLFLYQNRLIAKEDVWKD